MKNYKEFVSESRVSIDKMTDRELEVAYKTSSKNHPDTKQTSDLEKEMKKRGLKR